VQSPGDSPPSASGARLLKHGPQLADEDDVGQAGRVGASHIRSLAQTPLQARQRVRQAELAAVPVLLAGKGVSDTEAAQGPPCPPSRWLRALEVMHVKWEACSKV